MSRCFPYPPPGYNPGNILSRTGNLESITLRKEERERKKSKKEMTKKIKYRKLERKDVVIPEEVGERSGITEEHGDPSSDRSTENSGKRKRQCIKPDSQTSQSNLKSECFVRKADKKRRKMADQYRDLVENWKPPALSLSMHTDCDDDDWLLGSRKRLVNPVEKMRAAASTGCSSSSILWPPRAHFLPDASIYALPYVIPF